MCRLSLLIMITSFHVHLVASQESVHYLQSAIMQLKNMKAKQSVSRMDRQDTEAQYAALSNPRPSASVHRAHWSQNQDQNNAQTKSVMHRYTHTARVLQRHRDQDADHDHVPVPPLSLTKGELSAIYEAALAKGDTVKLNTGDDAIMAAAVHELQDNVAPIPDEGLKAHIPSIKYDQPSNDVAGYYYYYYPIKSFLDEMTSQSQVDEHEAQPTRTYGQHAHAPSKDPTTKPQFQYHSHAHQHTVNITALKTMLEGDKKKKALEPLFMAISGFIGMAVMFVLSVLVLPKFGLANKKPNVKKTERFGDLAKIALQAIEKQECAERLACELGKTARTFNLGNNRFVKLLKRLAPSTFGKQMEIVENYSKRRFRCTAIPCKKKGGQKVKPNPKQKKKS